MCAITQLGAPKTFAVPRAITPKLKYLESMLIKYVSYKNECVGYQERVTENE
jgi:hypothetical protein